MAANLAVRPALPAVELNNGMQTECRNAQTDTETGIKYSWEDMAYGRSRADIGRK